jgi:hypothetical protein
MTDDERRAAHITNLRRQIADLEREADNLEGRPTTGKEKIGESTPKSESKEPCAQSPSNESSSKSSSDDPPTPKQRPPIQDPGPSKQPGSFPEHSIWYNPALMKLMYGKVPNSTGQPAQQDQISSQQSGLLPRIPEIGPQTQPEWDQPLFVKNPFGDIGDDDDCIIVGGGTVDNPDVAIIDWDSEDSSGVDEIPKRSG